MIKRPDLDPRYCYPKKMPKLCNIIKRAEQDIYSGLGLRLSILEIARLKKYSQEVIKEFMDIPLGMLNPSIEAAYRFFIGEYNLSHSVLDKCLVRGIYDERVAEDLKIMQDSKHLI